MTTLLFPLFPIFLFSIPFIQKHKKIVKSARDKTKTTNPTRIDFMDEKSSREDQIKWSDKLIYFYESPIVRFYYYGVRN